MQSLLRLRIHDCVFTNNLLSCFVSGLSISSWPSLLLHDKINCLRCVSSLDICSLNCKRLLLLLDLQHHYRACRVRVGSIVAAPLVTCILDRIAAS